MRTSNNFNHVKSVLNDLLLSQNIQKAC